MTKRPTIADLCHGRLKPLPKYGEATREDRIAIQCANLQVMREEMGHVPAVFPQTDAEVPDWLDRSDRIVERCNAAIRGIARLPADTLLPSPFID